MEDCGHDDLEVALDFDVGLVEKWRELWVLYQRLLLCLRAAMRCRGWPVRTGIGSRRNAEGRRDCRLCCVVFQAALVDGQ